MRRYPAAGRRHPFRSVLALLAVSLGIGAFDPATLEAQSPGSACDLCPTPEDPIYQPGTANMVFSWAEAPVTSGRRFSNLETVFLDDTLGISVDIDILGQYVGECDYRLNMKVVRRTDLDDRRFQEAVVVAVIAENTENTGGGVATDIITVPWADTDFYFDPAILGNLGVRLGSNVSQPTTPLGTIQVRISGLNTTLSERAEYFVTALNSVTSLSDGLEIEVSGPITLPVDSLPPGTPTFNYTVTSPADTMRIMNGMWISFGEGSAAPEDTVVWSAHYLTPPGGFILADLEAFEGYRVWRSGLPDVDNFVLLGEIQTCFSKFTFSLVNEDEIAEIDLDLRYDPVARRFEVTDRDLHNDFPYRYAVSTFDRGFLGNDQDLTFEGERVESRTFFPALQRRDSNFDAYVVPNPYNQSVEWETGRPKVVFANLPSECTIRIFTAAADHVATILHGEGEPATESPTSATWDLRSTVGARIAPGIYIYYIDGIDRFERDLGNGETESVSQSYRHTGKMIVVR
jgi:hypothetical protein